VRAVLALLLAAMLPGTAAAAFRVTRLEGMRLRAEEMGGSVLWQSPEGGGTTVVIRFRIGRD
jgi:signal transduction histidine kinase